MKSNSLSGANLIGGLALCLMAALGSAEGQTPTSDWSSVVSRTKAAVVVIETDRGLGSGFLVRPNGTLVTNRHVIARATQIGVTFSTGEKYHKAFLLAEDDDRILRFSGSKALGFQVCKLRTRPMLTQVRKCSL